MSFVFTKNSVKSLDNKQQQHTVTVIPAPSIRSLFGVGKAHTLVLKGEDGVVGPEEDVSHDPQRPSNGRQVDAHEPADEQNEELMGYACYNLRKSRALHRTRWAPSQT